MESPSSDSLLPPLLRVDMSYFSVLLAPRATSTSGCANNPNLCEKPVSTSSLTIPITLGIIVPLVVAVGVLLFLHRRAMRHQKREDIEDPNRGLDFGTDDPKLRNMLDREKSIKGRRTRQVSMEIDTPGPYILPPQLHASRESLHSLARGLTTDDPYHPITQYADTASLNSFKRGKDDGSVKTGLSDWSFHTQNSRPFQPFSPPPRDISLRGQMATLSPTIAVTSPLPPLLLLPPLSLLPSMSAAVQAPSREATPPSWNGRTHIDDQLPTLPSLSHAQPDRQFEYKHDDTQAASRNMTTPSPALVVSHIEGEGAQRDLSGLPMQSLAPVAAKLSRIGLSSSPRQRPKWDHVPASMRAPTPDSQLTVEFREPSTAPFSQDNVRDPTMLAASARLGQDYANFPQQPLPADQYQPSDTQYSHSREQSSRYAELQPGPDHSQSSSLPLQPQSLKTGNLKTGNLAVTRFGDKRVSVGFRPLPPGDIAESDDPEYRASRIRSFYKEYFDDGKIEYLPPVPKSKSNQLTVPRPPIPQTSSLPLPSQQQQPQYQDDRQSTQSGSPEVYPSRRFYSYVPPDSPQPQQKHQQYYEDLDEQYLAEATYFDPEKNAFVMPYAQPVTRRAMTPPPARSRHYQGPPRTVYSSMGRPGPARGMAPLRPGYSTSNRFPPRTGSSMSGVSGPRVRKAGPGLPPAALTTLPNPSKLKDDMFAIISAGDFAPPNTYTDRARGRSQSPVGERKPYQLKVPIHVPLVSSYDELRGVPSPHLISQSTTFTGLEFAPPRRFQESGETMSDSGSIRSYGSNPSANSQVNLSAIRNQTHLPVDTIFSPAQMQQQLRPQWSMRV